MANEHDYDLSKADVFLVRFKEQYQEFTESEFKKIIKELLFIDEDLYKKRMSVVYKKFAQSKENPTGCPELAYNGPHKFNKLLAWLKKKYSERSATQADNLLLSRSSIPIDWQQVCCEVLKNQQKQWLTTCSLASGDRQMLDMYMPLGLVERKKLPRPNPDIPSERGSELYEEKITPIEHEVFFAQVLKQGQSPKSRVFRT